MKRTTRSWLKTALLGLLACLCVPGVANAWWDKQWTQREKLIVDTTSAGVAIAEPVKGAPILVRLHVGNFQFDQAKPDGSDIRFVTEDEKTILPHHVAQFDPALGEAFVWVRVPEIKPGAKTNLWLYYGNQTAPSVENSKGTYDGDTALVWHFGERGQPARDFSGNENNAANPGIPAEGTLIGTGVRFDGKSAVTVPAGPSLAWQAKGALTWSAWVKPTAASGRAIIFSRRDGAQNAFMVGTNEGVPFVEITNAGSVSQTPAAAPLTVNAWHHLAAVADGSHVTLYVDGESYGALDASIPALNSPATLGGDRATPDAEVTNGFTGEVVEFQIAHAARPAGFIKFLAGTQAGESGARAVTFGADEHGKSGGKHTGYFAVIIQSLTVDGWVVICILAAMSVVSLSVMVMKNRYITGALKGNECFLRLFEERVADDLTVLESAETQHLSSSVGGELSEEEEKAVSLSPLYRLYHIGAREIRKRITEDRDAHSKRSLSGASIRAINVSMDAGRARELQKLQKQMVLLTIAISGGPFLGLLGTVVGVMITFAAVAQAGDVNVNAIAPGIAAALLATVAGLAVAIPALFGYNYLLSRLKEVTVDMQVFVDEFIAKVTEFYSKRREKVPVPAEI
ncbi:MAG: DUF2341 domain-containing protein [Chthoniobacteraceae bacterium]|nr:DUF2341 domain-containing protein [Chthoniobacteraceae bacterium]